MLYFTKVFHTEEKGFLQFSFSCIVSTQKKKFHVTVLTRGPRCHHFVMEERLGKWKIISAPQPPVWILELEPVLEQFICCNQKQYVMANGDLRVVPLPEHVLPSNNYSLRKIG